MPRVATFLKKGKNKAKTNALSTKHAFLQHRCQNIQRIGVLRRFASGHNDTSEFSCGLLYYSPNQSEGASTFEFLRNSIVN